MPGGPTNKIKYLGGLCGETKGFQSLCLSIARAAAGAAGTLNAFSYRPLLAFGTSRCIRSHRCRTAAVRLQQMC